MTEVYENEGKKLTKPTIIFYLDTIICDLDLPSDVTSKVTNRHGKTGGSGWVKRIAGKKQVILSGLKRGSGFGPSRLTCIFHMNFF